MEIQREIQRVSSKVRDRCKNYNMLEFLHVRNLTAVFNLYMNTFKYYWRGHI